MWLELATQIKCIIQKYVTSLDPLSAVHTRTKRWKGKGQLIMLASLTQLTLVTKVIGFLVVKNEENESISSKHYH